MRLLLIFLISLPLFSQPWMENLTDEQRNNYFEIQNSFNEWVKDKDQSEKGQGIKQFKRWEYFWKNRIYSDGSFPTGKELDLLFEKSKNKNNPTLQSADQWKFIGRTTSPGGYNGLGRINVVKEDPNNSNIWWAGAASGGLWKTTNKGQSWTTSTDNTNNLSTIGISDVEIHPTNSSIMYLATGDRDANNTYGVGVLKSTNGGQSWNTTGLSYDVSNFRIVNRILIDPSNNNKLFAAVNNGVYISTDAGSNWNRTLQGNCKDIEFKPTNSQVVYATVHANPGKFYKSTDGGSNWTEITNGLPNSDIRRIEIAVTPADNDNVYLVASKNNNGLRGVYLSTNSGDSFTLLADSPNMLSHSIDGSSSGGQGWYDLAIAVPNNDKNTIFVGGVVTWVSTNLGVDWELSNFWYNTGGVPTVHADQHDFHFTKDHTFLVGNDGGVYASTNKGDTWQWLSEGLGITQYYKISASPETLDFLIGGSQDNGTMIKKKNGSWDDAVGGDGMKCLFDPTDEDIVYASIQNGDPLVKSTNGGNSFKRINDEDNDNEYDDITDNGPWVTPYDLDPSNTNIMYVGMQNIWKSTDGGKTFAKKTVSNNNSFVEVYVSKKNPNYVYALTSNQFFRSTDKGESWTGVARPGSTSASDFCIHPNNENILWATNGNWNGSSKVFYSTNGGDSWDNISSGLPNLPINCILYEDENVNRIYIGTDIGVYYRDDNTNAWTEFSEGLPRVIVDDLDINKANGRLYAGTYGRGFWFRDLSIELDEPVLKSPISGTKNLNFKSSNFSWSSVELATSYHLQIAKSSNFLSVDYENLSVNDTTLNVQDLLPNQQYFWRVKAKAGLSESDWTSAWNFKTSIGTTSLLLPDSSSFNNSLTLTLSWEPISGANSYKVQLSTTPNFSQIDFDLTSNSTSREIVGLSHNTKYYWRVAGVGSDGDGDWSGTWNFTTILATPVHNQPANDSRNNNFDLTLMWASVFGAQTYDIQVDDDPEFNSVDREISGHGLVELDIVELSPATKYYWRVKAHNTTSNSDWSQAWSFITKLLNNTLILPLNDSTYLDTDVKLVWNNVDKGDTSTIQLSDNFTFENIVIEENTSDSTLDITELDYNQLVYWRVKSFSNFGMNDWSEIFNFTTKLEPITLTSPGNNLENVNPNIELKWTVSDGATKYLVQLSDDEDFENIIHEDYSNTNSYVYLVQNNKVYFWRVKAENDNNESDWSEEFTFSTPIENPVLTSPANNSIIDETTLELEWRTITGASEYQVFLSESNQFTSNILSNNTTSQNKFSVDNLEFDKDYFWRVKATVNGNETDFSETWKFRIEKTLIIPAKVTLKLPVNGAIDLDTLTVQFEWEASTNASSYDFELAESNQFSNITSSKNDLTVTNHTVQNLISNKQYFWRVKAKSQDGEADFSDIWSITTIKPETTNSVNIANFNGNEYKIYPNPAKEVIYIETKDIFEIDKIEIYDVNANQVLSFNPSFDKIQKIDLSGLSNGIYVIKLQKDKDIQLLKFIKE